MNRMSRGIAGVAAALLVACAPTARTVPAPVPGHVGGEEAAVLEVMDAYLRAITDGDRATMASLQMADGMTYRARIGADGAVKVAGRTAASFTDPSRPADPPMRERYWAPTVLVRHAIAVVWAPYEFWVDGATSHCGVDVFTFVKADGRWRKANAMWTVEPEACAELRAMNREGARPAD